MMSRFNLAAVAIAAYGLVGASAAQAIAFDPFGALGSGGSFNGQDFTFDPSGTVFETEAWLSVNGGTSSLLDVDALPAGVSLTFDATLSGDGTDLIMSWTVQNTTAAALNDVMLVTFLDPEIDLDGNGFFNEYGEVMGTPGAGQTWEIDEPGFVFGDIFANAADGTLDNMNAVPNGLNEDVSMAIGHNVGTLGAMESITIRRLISEDGGVLGDLALILRDPDFQGGLWYSGDVVRSATNPIPEPSAAMLFGLGALVVRTARRRR